ncbi:MAG: SAM-dependent methyltransferase [Hyphomicrobiales bacterium]
MATAADLDFTYTQIDRLFRLSLGEVADFSGAKYDGDFSLSLEDAQRRKHEYIARGVRLSPGDRVLDLGCGWGPFLRYAEERGARATGVTLSSGQAAACRRNGLDVHVMDCRAVTPEAFGPFDALVSVGAFEHFCPPETYRAGGQEALYAAFFRGARALLPAGGRFYLQTMVFGRNMIPAEAIDLHAPRGSDAHVLALMGALFPGSWLPYGLAQIERTAAPHFRVVSAESGRLDYIETIRQWRLRFARFSWPKLWVKLSLVPRYLTSAEFRNAFASGISANTVCFERELLDHFRIVLEAVPEAAA